MWQKSWGRLLGDLTMLKWKSNIIGLLGILISLLAFFNKEDRPLVAVIFIAAIVFYIVESFSDDIEEHSEKITKLEEKLKIHEQLVALKGDIEYVKKEILKKEVSKK